MVLCSYQFTTLSFLLRNNNSRQKAVVQRSINADDNKNLRILVLFSFAYSSINFSYRVKFIKKENKKRKVLALVSILHTHWMNTLHCILICKSMWLQFIHVLHWIDQVTIRNFPIIGLFLYLFLQGFLDLLFNFVIRLWNSKVSSPLLMKAETCHFTQEYVNNFFFLKCLPFS